MSTLQMSHVVDLEQGGNHQRSAVGNDDVSAAEGSVCFSDADEEEGSCHSRFYSTNGGSYEDDCSFVCASSDPEGVSGVGVGGDAGRDSSASDCSVEVGIISDGNGNDVVAEMKVHLDNKVERDCRICHMGLESESHESGVPIELGCSCKDDLAAAHKYCAEAWFKIKGNRTCEICHSVARNVYGGNQESTEHSSNNTATAAAALSTTAPLAEARRFWHGHRFLNFLLACMVFAFVISWLFHFNVPSS